MIVDIYSNDVQQVHKIETNQSILSAFCKMFSFNYAGKMCQKILQRWQLLLPNLSALTESSVKERHMTQSHIPKYWFTSNWVYIKQAFIHQFILVRLEVYKVTYIFHYKKFTNRFERTDTQLISSWPNTAIHLSKLFIAISDSLQQRFVICLWFKPFQNWTLFNELNLAKYIHMQIRLYCS